MSSHHGRSGSAVQKEGGEGRGGLHGLHGIHVSSMQPPARPLPHQALQWDEPRCAGNTRRGQALHTHTHIHGAMDAQSPGRWRWSWGWPGLRGRRGRLRLPKAGKENKSVPRAKRWTGIPRGRTSLVWVKVVQETSRRRRSTPTPPLLPLPPEPMSLVAQEAVRPTTRLSWATALQPPLTGGIILVRCPDRNVHSLASPIEPSHHLDVHSPTQSLPP